MRYYAQFASHIFNFDNKRRSFVRADKKNILCIKGLSRFLHRREAPFWDQTNIERMFKYVLVCVFANCNMLQLAIAPLFLDLPTILLVPSPLHLLLTNYNCASFEDS